MTEKADFDPEEWRQVAEAPALAGLIAATADCGARPASLSMSRAYAEARRRLGHQALVEEIAAQPPPIDAERYGDVIRLRSDGLARVRESIALMERKASPEEVEAYRRFLLDVAEEAPEAVKPGGLLGIAGNRLSDPMRGAIAEITSALRSRPGSAQAEASIASG